MNITLDLGHGPRTHSVDEVHAVDSEIKLALPLVGEAAIALLYPGVELWADMDGDETIVAIDGYPDARGVRDEDGHIVWSAAGLPGVTRVSNGVDEDVEAPGTDVMLSVAPVVDLTPVPLLARRVGVAPGDYRGDAALFRLDPPITAGGDVIEFVIVSAVDLPDIGISDYRTSETMAFPATASGVVRDWGELGFVPDKDHAACLADMGYTIVAEEAEHEAAVQRSIDAPEVSLPKD